MIAWLHDLELRFTCTPQRRFVVTIFLAGFVFYGLDNLIPLIFGDNRPPITITKTYFKEKSGKPGQQVRLIVEAVRNRSCAGTAYPFWGNDRIQVQGDPRSAGANLKAGPYKLTLAKRIPLQAVPGETWKYWANLVYMCDGRPYTVLQPPRAIEIE